MLTQQTAQVAAQQGKYLAKMYGTLAKRIDTLDANEMPDHDDEMYYKPFKYLHLGTLAYIGNSYVSFPPPLPSSLFHSPLPFFAFTLVSPLDRLVPQWHDLMNSAVFDYEGYSLAGGLLAMYAWRS